MCKSANVLEARSKPQPVAGGARPSDGAAPGLRGDACAVAGEARGAPRRRAAVPPATERGAAASLKHSTHV